MQSAKGLLARLAFWATKRKVGKVVVPVRIHALHSALLFGYGQMELAQEKAGKLPAAIKSLAQIRVALRIGCPF
ncbi:MAG TPA: hypothetical protein VGB99_01650 [Acidobacteriota bacterium]